MAWLALGGVLLFASPVAATEPPALEASSLEDMSLEELLNLDVKVITSGRESTTLREVQEAMWVISREEIRRSGATCVAEVLRLVPGIDVVELVPTHFDVAARNHEAELANSLLVLIDSRPAYVSLFKLNLWSALPVVIEDIERIEIMLGPGSVAHGTNAVRGTVNIVTTRDTSKELRTRLALGPTFGAGNTAFDNGYVGGTFSTTVGELGVSLAASYKRHSPWSDTTYSNPPYATIGTSQTAAATARATLRLGQNTTLISRAGLGWLDGDYLPFFRVPANYSSYFGDLALASAELFVAGDTLENRVYARGNTISLPLMFDRALPAMSFSDSEIAWVLNSMYRFKLKERFVTTIGAEAEAQRFTSSVLNDTARSAYFGGLMVTEKVQ